MVISASLNGWFECEHVLPRHYMSSTTSCRHHGHGRSLASYFFASDLAFEQGNTFKQYELQGKSNQGAVSHAFHMRPVLRPRTI